MALVLADRVNETTSTAGTGAVSLAGAVTGYQSFSTIGNGNTTYYTISHQTLSEWEVGIGTYTSSGSSLSRDTVLASSNSGSLVNFSAGTKNVFSDYPAGRAVYLDSATNSTIPGITLSGGTASTIPYLNSTKAITTGTAIQFDGSNIGLNVTPSAWGSTIRALQFSQKASVGSNNLGATAFYSNLYHDGTNYIYNTTASGSSLQISNGTLQFNTAPSGTAGTAATLTTSLNATSTNFSFNGNTITFGGSTPNVNILPSTATNGAKFSISNTPSYGNIASFGTDSSAGTVTGSAYAQYLWQSSTYPIVFGTNSIVRGSIASTGGWTISAPTSGAALTVNALTGGTTSGGITLNGSGATPSIVVTFSATLMTVDCTKSNVFTTTFTANVTTAPTISNPQDGQTINWFITQDATGTRTMTWPTSFKWPGGTAGVLSTAANSVDLLIAVYRSSTGFWYASLQKAFA